VRRFGLVAVAGVALAMWATPTTALAHARYKSSTPATREVLSISPAKVTVTFTENIQKVSGTYGIDVALDGSSSVTSGAAVIDPGDRTTMSVPLNPLSAGRYEVHWKNVSDDDGDPLEGAFSFYVDTQPTAADLEKDAALSAIGAPDETPGATTSAGGSPAATTAPVATATTVSISAASPAATSTSGSNSGGGSNSTLIIVVVVVALVVVAGVGGFLYLRGRGT